MLTINVVEYDPRWPVHFEQIRSELAHALSDFLPLDRYEIEHVGSTSIPGLAAKPIIDIDIIVAAEDIMEATMALTSHGYTYAYEPGIDRMVFRYGNHKLDSGASAPTEDGSPRRAVYLNKRDGAALANHLAVKTVLSTDNTGLVEEYGDLKLELAKVGHADIGSYGAKKSQMIKRILAKSDLTEAELERIYTRPSRRVDAARAAAKEEARGRGTAASAQHPSHTT